MLSRAEFNAACLAFVRDKKWIWNDYYSGLGFLSRTVQFPMARSSSIESEEEEDEATAPISTQESCFCRQYVVLSPTFQTPTFYFSIHNSAGTPLSLDEILETPLFRKNAFQDADRTKFALTMPDVAFPLLSQGEHPTTGAPCWYLHPCETASAVTELLEEREKERVFSKDERSIALMECWFLVLGNVVNLDMN